MATAAGAAPRWRSAAERWTSSHAIVQIFPVQNNCRHPLGLRPPSGDFISTVGVQLRTMQAAQGLQSPPNLGNALL